MKKLLFLLLFLWNVCSINTYASHAMGGDLTYKCNGNNSYTFTFSFYRDCSGIPVLPTYDMTITNSCGFGNVSLVLSPVAGSPTQISPVCDGDTSTCDGGIYTGIQEWIYSSTYTLPGNCADWQFSISVNARNNSITTARSGVNLFIYSTLNNLNGTCNNSPTFANRPVPFACVGQQFCFNHGASDLDGDSLSYELITPRKGPLPSDTIDYSPPYTKDQPVRSSPPMRFNATTGDFCMFPTQPDVTVMAVLVKEWRNGVLIGQVERDIQLTVLQCNNILPVASGINGTPIFNTAVCANAQLCFWVGTADGNVSDTTAISWDAAIPNATLTTTNNKRDTAIFCWTPTKADVRNNPYCFTVSVRDNSCPYVGTQIYSYCITVNDVTANAGPDILLPCGVDTILTGYGIGGDNSYVYTWNPGSINQQQLTGVTPGTYIVTVESAGCYDSDTVSVIAGLGVPVPEYSFSTDCNGLTQFTDLSVINGGVINSWLWNFGDGNIDTIQNPHHLFLLDSVYSVSLTVTTSTGCDSTITYSVPISKDTPNSLFLWSNTCEGDSNRFMANPGYAYQWNFGDGSYSNQQNPKHLFITPGTYQVKLITTNQLGCSDSTTRFIEVFESPGITFNGISACENVPVQFTGMSNTPISSWSWDFGDGITTRAVSPKHTYTTAGTYYPTLNVISANGCKDSTTNEININPSPTIIVSANNNCLGYPTQFIDNSISSVGNIIKYHWNFGDGNFDTIQNPIHIFNIAGEKTITISITTDSGCVASNTITDIMEVYNSPDATYTNDAKFASDLNSTVTFTPNNVWCESYQWYFGDGDSSNSMIPSHGYPDTGVYQSKLIVTDSNGCVDSTSTEINILPAAVIYVPNSFTPNNDGINDIFKVSTINIIRLEIQIFDRWGILIYQSNDLEGNWNGNKDGNAVQADTYICRILATDGSGKTRLLIRPITILR